MAYDTAVVICFLGVAAITAYLAMNMDKKVHGLLQVLFIIVSMTMQYAAVGAVRVILDIEAISQFDSLVNSVLTAYFWVLFFTMFYVMLLFGWNWFKRMQSKGREKRGVPDEVSM